MLRAAWLLALLAAPDEPPPLGADQLRRAEALVRRLGEDDVDARDRASAGLAALGRSVVPFLGNWKPPKAGVYTVRIVYDVNWIHAADWTTANGPPEPAALRLLDRLPRGRHVSPVLKLTVEP